MQENDKFPEPIITPATKAEKGEHDEDISREEIITSLNKPENFYLAIVQIDGEETLKPLYAKGALSEHEPPFEHPFLVLKYLHFVFFY